MINLIQLIPLLQVAANADEAIYRRNLLRIIRRAGAGAMQAYLTGGLTGLMWHLEDIAFLQQQPRLPVSAAMLTTVLGSSSRYYEQDIQQMYDQHGTRLIGKDVDREGILETVGRLDAEGKSNNEIAKVIKDKVPSGRYKSPNTRARMIARTETGFAQRNLALAKYEAMGIYQVSVRDGLLPTSDDECRARHGSIVSTAEARQLALEEHPNGTLAFAPIINRPLPPAAPGEQAEARKQIIESVGKLTAERAVRLGRTVRRASGG